MDHFVVRARLTRLRLGTSRMKLALAIGRSDSYLSCNELEYKTPTASDKEKSVQCSAYRSMRRSPRRRHRAVRLLTRGAECFDRETQRRVAVKPNRINSEQ